MTKLCGRTEEYVFDSYSSPHTKDMTNPLGLYQGLYVSLVTWCAWTQLIAVTLWLIIEAVILYKQFLSSLKYKMSLHITLPFSCTNFRHLCFLIYGWFKNGMICCQPRWGNPSVRKKAEDTKLTNSIAESTALSHNPLSCVWVTSFEAKNSNSGCMKTLHAFILVTCVVWGHYYDDNKNKWPYKCP